MISVLSLLLSLQVAQVPDTIHLEVGSPQVDGRILPEHRARNRVYIGDAKEPSVSWTNDLVLGDSAGVQVMRWTTRGGATSGGDDWELLQTYNARTLAPLGYNLTAKNGTQIRLRIDGTRVTGTRRAAGAADAQAVDQTLDRAGFVASASDLVPLAVGLRKGVVMTAPIWGPNMPATETRVFTVVGEEVVHVEGVDVKAWKVIEQVAATGKVSATWWLTDYSPYMVLGEVPLPNGKVQRMTGVALKPGEQ